MKQGVWIMLAILLAGCAARSAPASTDAPPTQPAQATRTPRVTKADIWRQRWLKGEPCRPPCWEGITPGTTTLSETLEILKAHPNIINVEYLHDDWQRYIIWDWVDTMGRGSISAYPSGDDVTYELALDFSFRYDDVVASYGEPTSVAVRVVSTGHDGGIGYEALFLYEELRMILFWTHDEKSRFGTNMLLTGPLFFAPDSDLNNLIPYGKHNLAPWQGPQTFEFYCRDNCDLLKFVEGK